MKNFMEDITEEIMKQQSKVNYDMIVRDIIEIYNENYNSYEEYYNCICQYNKTIDKYNNDNIFNFGKNNKYLLTYYPRRIVLDEELYNAVIRYKNFINN